VDSALGKGSTFSFTLPVQTQASQSGERFLVGYKN
jgi:signal transduction histidine kinase